MKNLSHSASFDSCDKIAPSKSGIKHLVPNTRRLLDVDTSIAAGPPKGPKDGTNACEAELGGLSTAKETAASAAMPDEVQDRVNRMRKGARFQAI